MTGRKRGRRLAAALAVLAAAYAVWLTVSIIRFSPPAAGARPEAGTAGAPYEVTGAYHVHSKYSDGYGRPAGIAAAAARRGLDFVILTDHGNPNREALESQGRIAGVLLIAGSELSVSRGHLVALDFAPPERPFAQNAEQAAREVEARGGFTIIAHPYSKTSWTWGGEVSASGIEIADSDTMVRRNALRLLPYLPALAFKPALPLLKALSRPADTLRKWDSLTGERPVFGYLSADAHFLYRAVFSCFRLHALLEEPPAAKFEAARAQVLGALRRGRFYGAVDGAAPAAGFEFWAEDGGEAGAGGGGERFPMGSRVRRPAGGAAVRLHVRAPFAFAVETRLLRDGRVVERAEGRGAELHVAADRPGVYRVETYLRTRSPLADDFPWIISNPIFVDGSRP